MYGDAGPTASQRRPRYGHQGRRGAVQGDDEVQNGDRSSREDEALLWVQWGAEGRRRDPGGGHCLCKENVVESR